MSIVMDQDIGVIAPESLKVAVINTKAISYLGDARLGGGVRRCHRHSVFWQLVTPAKDEGIACFVRYIEI